jgi:murein L,D-transpeptidase YafK
MLQMSLLLKVNFVSFTTMIKPKAEFLCQFVANLKNGDIESWMRFKAEAAEVKGKTQTCEPHHLTKQHISWSKRKY